MPQTPPRHSPLVPLAVAAALFIAGGVAFIYAATDAGLALAQLASASTPAGLGQLGLACWAGALICVGMAAKRFLRRKK